MNLMNNNPKGSKNCRRLSNYSFSVLKSFLNYREKLLLAIFNNNTRKILGFETDFDKFLFRLRLFAEMKCLISITASNNNDSFRIFSILSRKYVNHKLYNKDQFISFFLGFLNYLKVSNYLECLKVQDNSLNLINIAFIEYYFYDDCFHWSSYIVKEFLMENKNLNYFTESLNNKFCGFCCNLTVKLHEIKYCDIIKFLKKQTNHITRMKTICCYKYEKFQISINFDYDIEENDSINNNNNSYGSSVSISKSLKEVNEKIMVKNLILNYFKTENMNEIDNEIENEVNTNTNTNTNNITNTNLNQFEYTDEKFRNTNKIIINIIDIFEVIEQSYIEEINFKIESINDKIIIILLMKQLKEIQKYFKNNCIFKVNNINIDDYVINNLYKCNSFDLNISNMIYDENYLLDLNKKKLFHELLIETNVIILINKKLSITFENEKQENGFISYFHKSLFNTEFELNEINISYINYSSKIYLLSLDLIKDIFEENINSKNFINRKIIIRICELGEHKYSSESNEFKSNIEIGNFEFLNCNLNLVRSIIQFSINKEIFGFSSDFKRLDIKLKNIKMLDFLFDSNSEKYIDLNKNDRKNNIKNEGKIKNENVHIICNEKLELKINKLCLCVENNDDECEYNCEKELNKNNISLFNSDCKSYKIIDLRLSISYISFYNDNIHDILKNKNLETLRILFTDINYSNFEMPIGENAKSNIYRLEFIYSCDLQLTNLIMSNLIECIQYNNSAFSLLKQLKVLVITNKKISNYIESKGSVSSYKNDEMNRFITLMKLIEDSKIFEKAIYVNFFGFILQNKS